MCARPLINRFEGLESRLLLTSFATLDSYGSLNVSGNSKDNVITTVVSGSKVKVTRDGSSLSFTKSKVKSIFVEGFGGNDKITNSVAIACELVGDSGNDTLVSNAGNDLLDGGAGNDSLSGGAGKDALHGKDGNDILDGGAGDDYFDGGSGNDTVDYSRRTTTIGGAITVFDNSNGYIARGGGGATATGATGQYQVEFDNYYEMETILGGSADDNLSFTNGDYPQGAARNFLLVGNGGNDRIVVGNWTRRDRRSHIAVRGGSGNDSIYAWGATVQVWGESGDDALYLRDSDNTSVTADLGSGFDSTELTSNDSIVAPHFTIPPGCERFRGLGNMTVTGNDLDNVIVLNAWPPTTMQVFGMGGNDLITFQRGRGAGTLTADGGAGNDTILGGDDNDSIRGGSGNDHIEAFDGNDTIFGDDGNDTLLGQKGNDQIHGGAGDDSVWGGTGNDSLWGDAGHDKLFGENDNDTLFAKDGTTDTLDGGSGTDKAQRDNSSTIKDSVLNVESYI